MRHLPGPIRQPDHSRKLYVLIAITAEILVNQGRIVDAKLPLLVVQTLHEACLQRPGRGRLLSLSTDLFEAGPTQAAQADVIPGNPSSSGSATSPTTAGSGSLSRGEAAGIGIGSGIGAVILTASVVLVLYSRHRRRALERQRQHADQLPTSESARWRDRGHVYHHSNEVSGQSLHEIGDVTRVGAVFEVSNERNR